MSEIKKNTQEENQTESDPIEDLLKQLHGQIKSSDWLKENTAEKFENENPELIKAWKEALDSQNS